MEPLIHVEDLTKSFGQRKILDRFQASFFPGELSVISGESGSGKTTLLNILGLLEPMDAGRITWWGQTNVKPQTLPAVRILRDKIGYLFQNFALIDNRDVDYNLSLALDQVKGSKAEKTQAKIEALKRVGLEGRLQTPIYELSGGEQQRVSIARLFLKPCELILADEPTGSLDTKNRDLILDMLIELKRTGIGIVISSHDPDIIDLADNNYRL